MTDKRSSSPDHLFATNTFHDWWLSELRTSLAPSAVDVPPPLPETATPTEPEPDPPPAPAVEPRSRAKLAFICATSLFWGAAIMLLIDGEDRHEASAATPRPVEGTVQVGEIQIVSQPSKPIEPGPFDRKQAGKAIEDARADATACAKGRVGSSRVAITFDSSGRARHAQLTSGPFVGTPIGKCIAERMRAIEVSAFRGPEVTVYKTIRVR